MTYGEKLLVVLAASVAATAVLGRHWKLPLWKAPPPPLDDAVLRALNAIAARGDADPAIEAELRLPVPRPVHHSLRWVPGGKWREELGERGVAVRALVTNVEPVRRVPMLWFAFRDRGGRTVQGCDRLRYRNALLPHVGDELTVLYDPEDPSMSSTYPMPHVSVAGAPAADGFSTVTG